MPVVALGFVETGGEAGGSVELLEVEIVAILEAGSAAVVEEIVVVVFLALVIRLSKLLNFAQARLIFLSLAKSTDIFGILPDPAEAVALPGPEIAPGVLTVGEPRPRAPGTSGRHLTVTTNHFRITIPENPIHHYDVIHTDKDMSMKGNHALIRNLQEDVAPDVFMHCSGYDGRANLYASHRLALENGNSQSFQVGMTRIEIKHVAEINPIHLRDYLAGRQSLDNRVLTVIAAMDVIIRTGPFSQFPFNSRSFFTDKEVRPVGHGMELWRGYFQSVRPGKHSMLVNLDISTGLMYAPGPMIGVCQQILKNNRPNALVFGQGLDNRQLRSLQNSLSGVRFLTSHKDKSGRVNEKPKVLRKISTQSASNYMFPGPDGVEMSVAQYFRSLGVNLQYPNYVCVVTPKGAAFPIELCSIIPGQLMRKQVPPDVVKSVVTFATKKPSKRLNSIVAGHQVLKHDESEVMHAFGITVDQEPEKCAARVLESPAIRYGPDSRTRHVRPVNGVWAVQGQKLFEPADIAGAWGIVNYDSRNVREDGIRQVINGLKQQADLLGIRGVNTDPCIFSPPAQAMNVMDDLFQTGRQVYQKSGKPPSLLVVVLPDNAADLYQAVKHFGDQGVATQCVQGIKVLGSRPQYWANVCLKVNAKLGGINCVLDTDVPELHFLADVAKPVMVIGADVMHPAAHVQDRPSFAGLVGSIDSHVARYSAISAPQDSRQEMIEDVEGMAYELIGCHAWWKQNREKKNNCFPQQGQFQQVLDKELPGLQAACKRHKINPTITIVIVGKRHHVRFFPTHGMADEKSENCPAGTVVEDVVGHPTEFDFYMQSHAGLLGTSRPAHYNVLHDENEFTLDSLETLSFGLCHLYARSTRAVSIPAPVYYADIVCERAKNHFHPSFNYSAAAETETTTSVSEDHTAAVESFKREFKRVHPAMRYRMFYQ